MKIKAQPQATLSKLYSEKARSSSRRRLLPRTRLCSNIHAATAENAVKTGDVPVALIIPRGFGLNPISFGSDKAAALRIELLNDASDMIAPQMVMGLLQKAAMTGMPDVMAEQGMKYTDRYIGGFTPEQQKRIRSNLDSLRQLQTAGASSGATNANAPSSASIIAIHSRAVVGERQGLRLLLCCCHWRHVPALHGERFCRSLARRSRFGHSRPCPQFACHNDHRF